MSDLNQPPSIHAAVRRNGSGAAAILATAVGCFALALLALVADKSPTFKSSMIFYRPTGPLSGVTSVAILIWIALWLLLDLRWKNRSLALRPICLISFVLLALSFLLTFPPIADLF